MLNRRTIANVYDSLMGCDDYDDAYSEDTLQHHGVLGMSWGDRHGPPYPLEGADKKAARADAKKKREQERRLRKLQKAAKKARKLKKKQAREQEQIEKKKAKLLKKGDLNAIRKNQKLFTNEELMAAVERKQLIDASKQPTKKERTNDEKMELAMKRMSQIADIASKTAVVLGAVKTGAEAVSAYKTSKVKDLEAEEKRNSNLSKQFDMIFKADPEAGKQFLKLNVPGYEGLVTSAKNEKANQKQSSNSENRLRLALANRTAYRSVDAPTTPVKQLNSNSQYTQTLKDGGEYATTLLGNIGTYKIDMRSDKEKRKDEKALGRLARDISSGTNAKQGSTSGGYWQSAYAKGSSSTPLISYTDPGVKETYQTGSDWVNGWLNSNWSGETYRLSSKVKPVKLGSTTPGYQMQHNGA